ncbi:MAG: transcriptional repressor [candidate division WOR-3 bacterium]|nr:MAG: transcriptional repressor [candidate division WOR-3 bacterium]
MNKHGEAIARFAKHKSTHGLKSSDKRSFVVDHFIQADRHFTVEELYFEVKKLRPEISYSTVYRALKLLAKCGLASESMFGETVSRYEPVHSSAHHDHLVCNKCGRIIEFENDKIEKLQKDVARNYDFLVSAHRLELYGLCKKCRRKKAL